MRHPYVASRSFAPNETPPELSPTFPTVSFERADSSPYRRAASDFHEPRRERRLDVGLHVDRARAEHLSHTDLGLQAGHLQIADDHRADVVLPPDRLNGLGVDLVASDGS